MVIIILKIHAGDKCVLIDDEPAIPVPIETPISSRRRTLSSRIHEINKEFLDNDNTTELSNTELVNDSS